MPDRNDALRSALKRAASTLKATGPEFALAGSYALWVYGGPEPVHDVDFVIDVLHRLNGVPVDKETIRSADVCEVLAIVMPVLSPTDVITERLCSLNEHLCDFAALLPGVRAVRERVDWDRVRADTADNDFAAAFQVLTERLGITS